jgi:hypothetical protein
VGVLNGVPKAVPILTVVSSPQDIVRVRSLRPTLRVGIALPRCPFALARAGRLTQRLQPMTHDTAPVLFQLVKAYFNQAGYSYAMRQGRHEFGQGDKLAHYNPVDGMLSGHLPATIHQNGFFEATPGDPRYQVKPSVTTAQVEAALAALNK